LGVLQTVNGYWQDDKKRYVLIATGLFMMMFITVISYFCWARGRMIPGLQVAGIKIGGLKISESEKLLEKELDPPLEKKVILNYRNRHLNVVLGAIGIKADIQATIKKAYQIGRTGTIWSQITTRVRGYRSGININPVFENNQDSLNSFYRLLDAIIAVEPVRSTIVVTRKGEVQFSPSRIGAVIDHVILTGLFEKALYVKELNRLEIPVKTVTPPLTESDIQNWGLNQVLGTYTTKFDPKKTDRVQNLRTASLAIDNTIVYPGQSFSFNTWVGPRVSEAGYKEAQVVLYGKLVPGIGGGICQVSSTLYNAVLLANLKVIQQANHTLASAYVPLARDATVVYGGTDLIFENNNPNPILLTARIEPPYVTVAVVGRKTGWEKVTLATKVLETIPFGLKETEDPTLPLGTKVKDKDGQNGYKVELWREVLLENGQTEKNRINTCIYPPQPEEYKVGTQKS
jgi:vancomycin resistance protein YoaR